MRQEIERYEGRLRFRPDVYGWDDRVAEALFATFLEDPNVNLRLAARLGSDVPFFVQPPAACCWAGPTTNRSSAACSPGRATGGHMCGCTTGRN